MPASLPVDPARGVRRTATGILGGLLAVFVATSLPEDPPNWVLLIRAMAEAGMVGGLADWFAVEALFRRPLGLPIPHTALLPANQKRAASNIARFIDEYFLDPDQLMAEMRRLDPVGKAGHWLAKRDNAQLIGAELAWAIRKLVHAQLERGIPSPVKAMVTESLGRATRGGTLPDHIADLMKEAVGSEFLDEVLLRVREAIDENRPAMIRLVQDRSRWWIASGVDRQVAGILVEGVISVLDELGDHDSPRRAAFAESVSSIIDRFREEGVISAFLESGMSDYAASPAFAQALDDLLGAALSEIDTRLEHEQEAVLRAMTGALQRIGRTVAQDANIRATIEERLEAALIPVLRGMRVPVREYVSRTIAEWDSTELVSRIEVEVGRDLQFIRINGAVLGSLLGGLLFLSGHFLL